MTTIAYKDGVIAYDSQISRGDVIVYDDYDKCLIRDGVRFFCAGATADFPVLVDAYFGGRQVGPVDVTALVLDGDILMLVAVDNDTGLWKTPIMRDRPYAIGSGMSFAFAAMDMGASADRAVEAAAKRDTGTGGTIRVFRIPADGQTNTSVQPA
ncbi:proteasome subunit beta [Pseudomonas capsici]|uniref:proteasome subunit beta n=1 Tax=Pseudomonas capsici TaxID=2810614 RepID=UPI0021F1C9A1|nr:proteasome subunit beta [Pseudomonas capsici]MCV4287882.1 proteasome subunit beta [Pseudomonas capsici]